MNTYNLVFWLLFQYSFVCDQALEFPQSSRIPDSQQKQTSDKAAAANIIFKSIDGGQTWQDISEGLPENLEGDGIQRDGFFANDSGLYLHAGNGIYHSQPSSTAPYWKKEIYLYHSNPNSTAPFWKKENYPDEHSSIVPGKTGLFAYNYDGQFLQKINGTSIWSPMYTNLQVKEVRTVFETAGGTVFIGSDNGLFKSTNGGKTWKQVRNRGWVMKMVESNGVLMATSQGGILRSTDDGENWDYVISEGGVGIAIERIDGGFAAISCNTTTQSRRIHISLDSGKTWKAIEGGLQPSLYISSIKQMGEYLICGHPDGVFRTSDMGKTWELLLPSIENKVFNISVSGNVIYAIPRSGGC